MAGRACRYRVWILNGSGNRGVIVWNQDSCGFLVDFYDHGLDELGDWAKKTGRDRHDTDW